MRNIVCLFFILFFSNLLLSQFKKSIQESPYKLIKTSTSINKNNFYDLTKSLPIKYVKDGSVDYTYYIQKAIDKYDKIIFPNFPIASKGVILRSNSEIFFQENSKILLIPNSLERYQIIALHGVENVKLYNINIVGDKGTHLGVKGEWGFGIDIRKSQNIYIENASINNCWGDGIVISNSSRNNLNPNSKINTNKISINNSVINNSRRNGLSIISGNNISINNLIVNNTFGTAPMSGIDIEPDNNKELLNNIYIDNLKVFNAYSGIQIHLNNYASKFKSLDINIYLNKIETSNTSVGILVAGFDKKPDLTLINGKIVINDLFVKNSNREFVKANQYGIYPKIQLKNYKFLKNGKELYNNEIELLKYIKDIKGIEYK
ncbi:right-handed parallel beta-helix repeat-containing protein [Empedobacter sp. GD03739]|uniref:right-handed parallel beta-helix repeat-containing protein n=1 Tax=Empedobacter sp. GD03739 TaxID=2975376 RepID=UPI002446A3E5|nr:right-handed parallel beta-helix repeat-containing protein [Empedobacter sp. GD03739]MDH1601217.1 right-handed parallel beta-helix repeat-containing protein [Empedobacter sp. GD03739]